jgi:hypothetical protein
MAREEEARDALCKAEQALSELRIHGEHGESADIVAAQLRSKYTHVATMMVIEFTNNI